MTDIPGVTFDVAEDNELNDLLNAGATRAGAPGGDTPVEQQMDNIRFGVEFSQRMENIGAEIVESIENTSNTPEEKQKSIVRALTSMIPAALREVGSIRPDADRSLVISRSTILLKQIGEMVGNIEKSKADATINPHAPRFREAFAMFLDEVMGALNEVGPTETQRDQFFRSLSDRLRGWEERVEGMNSMSVQVRAKKVTPNAMSIVDGREMARVIHVPPNSRAN